jgi:hypothetical protein
MICIYSSPFPLSYNSLPQKELLAINQSFVLFILQPFEVGSILTKITPERYLIFFSPRAS